MGDICMAGTDFGDSIYSYWLYWLFVAHFSLEGYRVQPRYSGEGLGPSSEHVLDFVGLKAFPSLRSEWG